MQKKNYGKRKRVIKPKQDKLLETETILSDDYPVHPFVAYIVDMKLTPCYFEGTVGQWKTMDGIKEIRRCSLFSHGGMKYGDILKNYVK